MTDPNCWYPKTHTQNGECDGLLISPHYPTMPDRIRIFDRAAKTYFPMGKRRNAWRSWRDTAIGRWGYPVEVIELKDPNAYRPGGITLGIFTPPAGYNNSYGGFGLAPIDPPMEANYDQAAMDAAKGFAQIHSNVVRNAFLSRVSGTAKGIICHEVGHALGFGHGGTGIMESLVNAPYYPNLEELDALEAYWGKA